MSDNMFNEREGLDSCIIIRNSVLDRIKYRCAHLIPYKCLVSVLKYEHIKYIFFK